ncbi:MAG: class I SAM-dependent methyltransferase [Micavibrio aeruginosavorus]|uniref:Class I SAM-dependent methyltransferase n=1 Tax=Micavibrio aeruginosavorus TaxID=349221 RepID=A0A7T5R167_9BACT|nr:MAG: class I SAM-dependent methyltransferase [Micavibrio aeruginosavorus]
MDQDVYHRMADIQDRHWWYEGRRRILAHLIRRLDLPSGANILEAGCGPGANLKMLSQFGKVFAFEPDDFAINYCRANSGIPADRLQSGFLPAPIPFKGPFDVVGAFDVIEHVEADQESLNALYALTKIGGYALFTVPAYSFLWSQHDVVNHHKRRYLRRDFRELLIKAGYRVEYISYYNTVLFPLVAAVRLIKKAIRVKDRPDETLPRCDVINLALRTIFAAERFVLGRIPLPCGVSIIAICRKPENAL